MTPSVAEGSRGASGLRLDGLVRFVFSLSMDRLMAVLYQGEWMRNNHGHGAAVARRFLPFFADPVLLASASRLLRLLPGALRRPDEKG